MPRASQRCPFTMIAFHYVRERSSEFPLIKGKLPQEFEGQLDYLLSHYKVIDMKEVCDAIQKNRDLPENACLLTFDDGLIDHYQTVYPALVRRRITGSFYPIAATLSGRIVLDVHKIHQILARNHDATVIKDKLLQILNRCRRKYPIPEEEELLARHAKPYNFDGADTGFIKRLLQTALPREIRHEITAELYSHFVGGDEKTRAEELYLSKAMIKEMIANGMFFGGHGYRHEWLGHLPRTEQENEIKQTAAFLEDIYGTPQNHWVMAYPYGSYNADTLDLLPQHGCRVGLASGFDLSTVNPPLEIKRLDTNDFPVSGDAPFSPWTLKARSQGAPR